VAEFNALMQDLRIVPPIEPNALLRPPTQADAWTQNTGAVGDWVAEQRAISAERGLWNPETGLPTLNGLLDAAKQYVSTFEGGIKARPSVSLPVRPAAPGEAERISTRVPWAVPKKGETVVDPHTTSDLTVGLDSSRASGEAYAKNADIIRGYSDIPTSGLRNPEKITERLIDHVTDNLAHLYQAIPAEIREASKRWYDGANTIAHRWAADYGLQPRQAAGALAAMSPQKDWFQNVDLAQRVVETRARQGNMAATPEMHAKLQRYVDAQKQPAVRDVMQEMVDKIRRGTPLGALDDPLEQSLWIRAFDEAHNPRGYQIVSPEGAFTGPALTDAGRPQQVGWGSFNEIAKANRVLNDGSLPNISGSMGGNHKVRNFYNNIIAPNSGKGDVTIDTHAIAAGHLRPLSGNHPEVSNGLGLTGSPSAATGSRGLYGLYAEAYRRAAVQAGILPREMQSVTWEGVRGLFSPEQKRDVRFTQSVSDIWDQYRRGQIDALRARANIHDIAGGIDPPAWWRPGP
jgi:hypothetical protein